ncbi:MAG: MotA/TolQ/ExbB proton channel family protein [Methanothrix sp.]|uniref:Outer membrane transport energization protein ExbB n=1 Tax=Methanothrix thermoacetophila (strain DSM 6194 / JCM 14653 / NBRC 101360 / PT) TaxID=349307 RepID=A0B8B5_METTP|nr:MULTISPECIES: MotA/TolQ/ExbB proton channel family protein [Methanothrix]ABK14939.1 outer membrane transport energization protein ExbB [Methanothrix thermoacetophila PT]MBC7078937.1 MotA/TolQ/ExbB proton channel family protein [Methanothrix sp.]NPU87098.1 MotA/TolQ/ExbB proton channel family protein [Methanothrix sp.]
MIYETTVSLLYIFSTSLLYPDMICLLVLFGWSLILVGSVIQEYTSRRRDVHELEEVTLRAASLASSGREKEAAEVLSGYRSPQLAGVLGEIAASLESNILRVRLEKILQDAELDMARRLEPLRIGMRVGPILGLMGTLIPMGPALVSLSRGDVQSMAASLIIAFATTVIGLVVGGICYCSLLIRNRWYHQDLSDLEYSAAILRRALDERPDGHS